MATCPRCGKGPIRKRKDKRRKCSRCGFLPSGQHLERNGLPKGFEMIPQYEVLPTRNAYGEIVGWCVYQDDQPYTFHPSKEEAERKAIQYADLDELVALRERDQANNSAEAC